MSNINIECENDDYYDKFIEESSPRTNYGEGYSEKMKDEYIIISKTAILKRIEELEKEYKSESAHQFNTYVGKLMKEIMIEIMILKQILSQSTPLIPEIEKGVKEGLSICLSKKDWAYGISGSVKQDIREYVSNLKLDI